MIRTLITPTGAVLAELALVTSAAAAAPAAGTMDETSEAVDQFVDGALDGNPGSEVSDSAGNGVDS